MLDSDSASEDSDTDENNAQIPAPQTENDWLSESINSDQNKATIDKLIKEVKGLNPSFSASESCVALCGVHCFHLLYFNF